MHIYGQQDFEMDVIERVAEIFGEKAHEITHALGAAASFYDFAMTMANHASHLPEIEYQSFLAFWREKRDLVNASVA